MINITDEYPKESYVRNCFIDGEIEEVIFTVVDGKVIESLDSYAIIPIEDYKNQKIYIVMQDNTIHSVYRSRFTAETYIDKVEGFDIIEINIDK